MTEPRETGRAFVRVAALSDVPPGTSRAFEVAGREIALVNVGGRIFACSNICPHQGGPMADGILDGTCLVCPWHGWSFDLATGTSPVNPKLRIEVYAAKVENDEIFVSV